MKNLVYISLLSLFLFLNSCSESKRAENEKLKIIGTLLGYDDKPMQNADISLVVYKGKENKKASTKANKDGSFELVAEYDGKVRMTFSGVNHFMETISFNTDKNTNHIEMKVNLQGLKIKDEPQEVKVIGSFNDYDFNSALPMSDEGDGKYSVTVKKDSDTLFYQIIGHLQLAEQRSTNGTMQDFYVYDGGGDYRSVIVNKDSEVKIVFDSKKMNFENKLFSFTSNNEEITEMVKGFAEIDRLMSELISEIRKHFPAKSKMKQKLINRAMERKFEALKGLEEQFKSDVVRSKIKSAYLSNMSYLSALSSKDYIDKEYVKSILMECKSDSSLFIDNIGNIMYAYEAIGESKLENELFTTYLGQNNDEIKPRILIEKIAFSKNSNDTVNWNKYYSEFMENYSETEEANSVKREYKPNPNIAIGNTLPEFSVLNLSDGKTKFDNKQLEGKYVLIDVWATWCGPCRGEMPHLHEAYERFKGNNFTILSISVDEKAETALTYQEGEWKMPWLNAIGENAWASSVMDKFEVTGIPSCFLINPKGEIIALSDKLRGEALISTLEGVL